MRRAPIKRNPRRRRPADHGMTSWNMVRLVILDRAGGRCELCGTPIGLDQLEGHHRRTRSIGPDCPCNALALCGSCHHGPQVHGSPDRARELGTIVSRFDVREPGEIPVRLFDGRLVLLACDGTIHDLD